MGLDLLVNKYDKNGLALGLWLAKIKDPNAPLPVHDEQVTGDLPSFSLVRAMNPDDLEALFAKSVFKFYNPYGNQAWRVRRDLYAVSWNRLVELAEETLGAEYLAHVDALLYGGVGPFTDRHLIATARPYHILRKPALK